MAVKVSEKVFQRQIVELAHRLRWKIVHFRPAMTSHGWRTPVQGDGTGFFDCIMFKPPRLILAELKSDTGKLTKGKVILTGRRSKYVMGEEDWKQIYLQYPYIEVYVWRPVDLEEIARILQRPTV